MKPSDLFDSYSGEHIADVLCRIEARTRTEMRKEADSEFLRGEMSAVAEIRWILSDASDGYRAVAGRSAFSAPPGVDERLPPTSSSARMAQ